MTNQDEAESAEPAPNEAEDVPGAEPSEASGEAASEEPASGDPASGEAASEGPALESYAPFSPVVTSTRPSRADARGGTAVTVIGVGFVPGCSVFLGEDELIADLVDPFTLRFVAPAREGRVKVDVVAPSGARSTGSVELEFVAGPEVARAIPDEAPIEGGVRVILEGARFEAGCTVSLFGAHAPEVEVETERRIAFFVPPAGDGPLEGAIVVTNPDGLADRKEGLFRYRPLEPRLESIEPGRGWVNGGKLVTLKGADFHRKARVTIGANEAAVTWRDRQTLAVEVPASEAEGAVDVTVINPDGRDAALEKAFIYEPIPAPPKLIDVIPRSGKTTGGVTIRLSGDNFTDDVRVRIGEVTAVRKVLSAKLIDVELPPRAMPGAVAVELTAGDVTVRAEDAFTYESPRAPKITHVEPRSGPTSGGTRVIIEGEGFPKNASVRFGGEPAKTVVVKDGTRIEAVTPPAKAAGAVDVEVSSAETGPGISRAGFGYEKVPPPVITVVAPNKGTVDGGTELSIEGKNFAEGAVVLVDGLPAKTRRISGSVLEAKTPGGDDGKMVDVVVKNPDGQQAVQKRAFQYDARYRS